MHAATVLQRSLGPAFEAMHALRRRTVLLAVRALIASRHLVQIELARFWPGAVKVEAPLKRLDRLLSNPRLHAEVDGLYQAMAHRLICSPQPILVVDWSMVGLKDRYAVLRAAIPFGGRALTIYEQVFPAEQQGSKKAEDRFLAKLHELVPCTTTPVIVVDAGFRTRWFRAVEALGWAVIGRLRHITKVRADGSTAWIDGKSLHPRATHRPTDLGVHLQALRQRWPCRLIAYRKALRGRHHLTRQGTRSADTKSLDAAQREREPWILMASTSLKLNADQIVAIYRKRMQIEEAFRDLKSHRYGRGFEDSLTRIGKRLTVLLLLDALATFAAWIVGTKAKEQQLDLYLAPGKSMRDAYSIVRLGWEALKHRWLRTDELLQHLRNNGHAPPASGAWC